MPSHLQQVTREVADVTLRHDQADEVRSNESFKNGNANVNGNHSTQLAGSVSLHCRSADSSSAAGSQKLSSVARFPDDIATNFEALQIALQQMGFPETEVRTDFEVGITSCNMSTTRNRDTPVTIVAISPAANCIGLLAEVANRCPGGAMMVLSPSWLTKRPSKLSRLTAGDSTDENEMMSLYVAKAVIFHQAGKTVLDCFNPPRRVSYLVNMLDGNAAADLEAGIDCPVIHSSKVTSFLRDFIWSREVLHDLVDVDVTSSCRCPLSLAFVCRHKSDKKPPAESRYGADIVYLTLRTDVTDVGAVVQNAIEKFVNQNNLTKIVVKKFFRKRRSTDSLLLSCDQSEDNRMQKIARLVLSMAADADHGDAVVVEEFCHASATAVPEGDKPKWAAGEGDSHRIRAVVCRGIDNRGHMTRVVCRVGGSRSLPTSINTLPLTFETLLTTIGIMDASERENLHAVIRTTSERVYDVMDRRIQPNCDFIGLDFVLCPTNGTLVPVCVDIVDHFGCMGDSQAYEILLPEQFGTSLRPLVDTMLLRSQQFTMRGKKVAVIDAGDFSHFPIFLAARHYGIEIYIVGCNPSPSTIEHVTKFITYDYRDHTRDQYHSTQVARLITEATGGEVDGCLTFWEDCGPLAAYVCEELGLNGASVRGAVSAKRKSSTLDAILKATLVNRHYPSSGLLPPSSLYSSAVRRIQSEADFDAIAAEENRRNNVVAATSTSSTKQLTFPCVIKLEFGNAAIGGKLVEDLSAARSHWAAVQRDMSAGEKQYPGFGLGHGGPQMMMMDFVGGTEHGVDLVIYRRRLLAAYVSDCGPTRLPKFTWTSDSMPSQLPADRRRQLAVASFQSCIDVGLVSGVFNVGIKLTADGPRVLEINARMSGFGARAWHLAIYGVDLAFLAMMIACDLCPTVVEIPSDGRQLIAAAIVPSACDYQSWSNLEAMADSTHNAGTNEEVIGLLDGRHALGQVKVHLFEAEVSPAWSTPMFSAGYEDPFAAVSVLEKDLDAAKRRITEVFRQHGIDKPGNYQVGQFLADYRKWNKSE